LDCLVKSLNNPKMREGFYTTELLICVYNILISQNRKSKYVYYHISFSHMYI